MAGGVDSLGLLFFPVLFLSNFGQVYREIDVVY